MENTAANVKKVDELVHWIYSEGTLDIPHLYALEKLFKGRRSALAGSTLLRVTNQKLITANTRKQQKVNCSRAQYTGDAWVLSLEDVNWRKQRAIDRQKKEDEKKKQSKLNVWNKNLTKHSKN